MANFTPDVFKSRAAISRSALSSFTADVLFVAGAALVFLGVWLIYPPAVFVLVGLAALAASVLIARPK